MPKRGENIYKRKDGRWEGRYIKKRELDGSAVYGYVYAKSYGELREKLEESKHGTEETRHRAKGKTMSEVCTMWLSATRLHVKEATYAKYRNIVFNHIVPCIGSLDFYSADSMTVRKLIEEKCCTLAASTTKTLLTVLKSVFRYADNIGMHNGTVFTGINIKSPETEIEVLSKSEQEIFTNYLLNNVDNTNLGILLCLYTGIRIGEICALTFDDISLEDKTLHIGKTMQRLQSFESDGGKTRVTVEPPKSRTSIRDIPIPEFILGVIAENNLYVPRAYVLTGDRVAFVEPRTLENRFKTQLNICKLRPVNFHVLRHTFATRSIELGFDVKTLSEILGHSSVNITLGRYVHSSLEMKKTNMAKFDLICRKNNF